MWHTEAEKANMQTQLQICDDNIFNHISNFKFTLKVYNLPIISPAILKWPGISMREGVTKVIVSKAEDSEIECFYIVKHKVQYIN